MTATRWGRVQLLCHSASELSEPARSQFLAENCAGDAEMLREIKSLLARSEAADNFLRSSLQEAAADVSEDSLLQQIGRLFGDQPSR